LCFSHFFNSRRGGGVSNFKTSEVFYEFSICCLDASNPKPPAHESHDDSTSNGKSSEVPDATPSEPQSYNHARCVYRFPSGPRCRNPICPEHPQLCTVHLQHSASLQSPGDPQAPPAPPFDDALVAEIASLAGDFSSPEQVSRVMAKIFHSLLHRRISTKEAGMLCYIAQTILQSQRTVSYLEKSTAQAAAAKPKVRTYIHDLPMARRD
jgi:hypothetical protein